MTEWVWLFVHSWYATLHIGSTLLLLPLVWYDLFEPTVTIETLTGFNYEKWRSDIELALGLIDLEICLLEDKYVASSDKSSSGLKT